MGHLKGVSEFVHFRLLIHVKVFLLIVKTHRFKEY